MLGSLYMLGLLIGAVIGGCFSDKFGRKKVFMISAFLTGPLYFGQAFVPNYYTYAGLRLACVVVSYLAAFGSFPLKLEMVSHQYRRYVMLLRDIQMTVGNLILAGLAYYIRDWRILQMICAAPLLLQPLLYFVIPESVSWLVSTGNYQGAVETLKNAAKKNGKKNVDHDEAQLLISGMAQQIEMDDKEKSPGCCQLLSQSKLRTNLVVMMFNWSAVTIAWYGLALNIDILSGDIIFNFTLMVLVDVPASLIGFLLLGCTGRKQAFILSQLGSGVACIASGLLSDPFLKTFIVYMDPSQLQNILCFVGKFFATMSFSVCYLFTMELFPTKVRSTSLGTCSALARILGAATPYMKHLRLFWLPLPLVAMGAPSVLGALLVAFLPETRGRGLPESAEQAVQMKRRTGKET
ncbi:organic cation transporter protein-like isoform X2 [Tigriopus californicus]|nr:organic cation transporter protein-like isoform X2 [Tigriopus californicus]